MKYLFIAEKPSLMRSVKKVYDKYPEIQDSVGEIVFTALHGHICGYAEPKDYEEWSGPWSKIPIPIFPENWKINVKDKALFREIKKKYKDNGCNGLIVGTDADVEGNGIFYLLKEKAKWNKVETLRFFVNDLTDSSIKKSLLTMTDFKTHPRDVRMTECYLLRSHFDWEVGMNMTIGAKVNTGNLLRIGRVKAPTLKIIYDNCKAIDDFVPKETWSVDCIYDNGMEGTLIGKDGKNLAFEKKQDANAILSDIPRDGVISKLDQKEKKTNAPKLYKLSDLQTDAGSLTSISHKGHRFSPKETLDLVQSLYEKKLLSYPRTDGRYVSTEKAKEFPEILRALSYFPEYAPFTSVDATLPLKSSLYVNDKEVEKASHDALIPTLQNPDGITISPDEKQIYDLVVRRFLSIFQPPLIESKTTAIVTAGKYDFISSGTEVIDKGWTEVANIRKKNNLLPPLKKGMSLHMDKVFAKSHTTSPPKRLTEATLIKAMENIASSFDEEEYKAIMKEESGIGTPASRGGIIKELKDSGCFTTRNNAIYITDFGKNYIKQLEGCDIIDPVLTAKMELHLKHVREGSENYHDVEKILIERVKTMTNQTKNMGYGKFVCPKCKKEMKDNGRNVSCDCGLTVWKRVASRQLSDEEIEQLLTKGKTDLLEGFVSKAGKNFNAYLKLDNGNVVFEFPSNKSSFKCPNCGEYLTTYQWGYGCPNRDFRIGKVAGVTLSENQIKNLLEKKNTGLIEGFISKAGKPFSAELHLNDNNEVIFHFPDNKGNNGGGNSQETDMKCPVCGNSLRKFNFGFACPKRDFIVGRVASRMIEEKELRELLKNGRVGPLDGFTSKSGNKFSASLILTDKGQITFSYD